MNPKEIQARPDTPMNMQQLQYMQMLQRQQMMQNQTPARSDTAHLQQAQKFYQMAQMARLQGTPMPSFPIRTPVPAGIPNPIAGSARPLQRIPFRMTPGQTPAPQARRQIVIPNTGSMAQAKSNLLPPSNSYAPRLKYGYTSLVIPNSPEEKTRKRSRFVEHESEEEEEENFDSASFEDSEDENGQRRTRSTVKTVETLVEEDEGEKEIDPFQLQKRARLLTTKHDFEKMYFSPFT